MIRPEKKRARYRVSLLLNILKKINIEKYYKPSARLTWPEPMRAEV
jgi:hypothetical protein